MKTIFSMLFLLGIALSMKAQINDPNAPIFKFNEETHDFGNVKEGAQPTFDFEFTNTGKTPLLIQSCTASCGCTTPDWTKSPIKPGQKGKISVKYNSAGHGGEKINKTVYITSNAQSDKKKYELYIKGNVLADPNKTQPTNVVPVKN